MSSFVDARRTLFHALLGGAPQLAPEARVQLQALVATYGDVCAAFDELVSVIVPTEKPTTDRKTPADWRDELHDYVEAQLSGRAYTNQFAALRQQLDKDVTLAEEYALLYETMQAEYTGRLPAPTDIPAVNLAFLQPEPSEPVASPRASGRPVRFWGVSAGLWLRRIAPLTVLGFVIGYFAPRWPVTVAPLVVGLVMLFAALLVVAVSDQRVGGFGGLRTPVASGSAWLRTAFLVALIMATGVSFGAMTSNSPWRTPSPTATLAPTTAPMRRFLEQQMALEAQLPTPAAALAPTSVQVRRSPCIDYQRGLFWRRACPV